MNILFVHEVDWLNKVVFDIHSLAEALSLMGHRVFAVDYENTWKRKSLLDMGSLKSRSFDGVSRAFPGSSVNLRRPGFIKIPGVSRLSAGVTSYAELRKCVKEENIDAIVLYSVPTNGLQTINIARKYDIPVIFRSIDILNQLVSYKALRPITRLLEKKVYSRADMILTLTPGLSKYVAELGADESKIRLLLMPVDTNIFYPQPPPDELRRKWGLSSDDRIVLFMGTLFDFSGLDALIPQFPEILKKVPEAKLLIVGDGPQRPKLDALISDLELQGSVIITGFEPYETMPQYINLASICINTFLITGATRDIFPGKTVQFLACGKPFIATALPGMIAVVAGEGQGVIYVNDADEMATEIISLLGSDTSRQQLGQAGLDYVKQVHGYDKIAYQLEQRIKEVREDKGNG